VAAGQVLVGMDFRPATGECFALGYNSMNGDSRLYTINLQSGAASAVGMMPFTLDLGNGANVGFDFNPTVDRIRVVAGNNTNYRLNPITGGIAATDSNLAFAIGDINQAIEPAIGAAAYTNSYNTAATTTLYCFDEVLGLLVTQIPPNNGTLNTVGLTGILPNMADPSCDMDIYYDFESATNIAYCTANPGTGMNDMLYSLNLGTGMATVKGKIGLGIAIRDIAIFPDSLISVAVKDVVQEDPNSLSCFPNPAVAQFQVNFELALAADTRILLTDIAGRVVRSVESGKLGAGRQQQTIDLTEVTTGVYFVQLYLDNKLQGINKVIVNK
jgi:trimeric autotransporter adhesin